MYFKWHCNQLVLTRYNSCGGNYNLEFPFLPTLYCTLPWCPQDYPKQQFTNCPLLAVAAAAAIASAAAAAAACWLCRNR